MIAGSHNTIPPGLLRKTRNNFTKSFRKLPPSGIWRLIFDVPIVAPRVRIYQACRLFNTAARSDAGIELDEGIPIALIDERPDSNPSS